MDRNSRSVSDYRVIRNVTVVGSVVDGLLALGKLTGGIVAQSQALIVSSSSPLVIQAKKRTQSIPMGTDVSRQSRLLCWQCLSRRLHWASRGMRYRD